MNRHTRSTDNPAQASRGRLVTILLSLVITAAIVGYFIGIADGVPQPDGLHSTDLIHRELAQAHSALADPKVIPAVSYAEIPQTTMGPTAVWQANAIVLPQTAYDLFAEVVPSEVEKEASGRERASRRAFNGAPPIIPHEVQNTSDAACYACHSKGLRMGELKASVMSHQFLANCTQCHASPPPSPFKDVAMEVETSFVGLPAPKQGERAFPGAPPTIPHSQWMRDNCLACHGGANGWAGLETTHPWRTNCTQCHAPSAKFDQAITVQVVPMLPPLNVVGE